MGQGNVFTPVILYTGGCIPGKTPSSRQIPLGRHPQVDSPQADNPMPDTLLGRHPLGRHPPGQTPPRQTLLGQTPPPKMETDVGSIHPSEMHSCLEHELAIVTKSFSPLNLN